jgi:hypothetical protein
MRSGAQQLEICPVRVIINTCEAAWRAAGSLRLHRTQIHVPLHRISKLALASTTRHASTGAGVLAVLTWACSAPFSAAKAVARRSAASTCLCKFHCHGHPYCLTVVAASLPQASLW